MHGHDSGRSLKEISVGSNIKVDFYNFCYRVFYQLIPFANLRTKLRRVQVSPLRLKWI